MRQKTNNRRAEAKKSTVHTHNRRPQRRKKTSNEKAPTNWGALLGKPPLLPGESAQEYENLRAEVRSAVEPKDALEEIWVEDITYLIWEVRRLRRMKAQWLQMAAKDALGHLLSTIRPLLLDKENLIRDWERGEREALTEVAVILEERGLDEGSILAQAFGLRLGELNVMDELISRAETRRYTAIKEMDRRRETPAYERRALRAIIEDGEFKEVD